ncbi:unnamed protein product [Brugia pahangi]|uniref:Uncharacterized protein n=1 Tax=Brugia pahangi TaxID=6280 RepID=A0A0N4TFM2_BRUPA|nr:unnamed protein product [Brugia pahangi]
MENLELEAWGIEPQTSPMRTERSTPELCPLTQKVNNLCDKFFSEFLKKL